MANQKQAAKAAKAAQQAQQQQCTERKKTLIGVVAVIAALVLIIGGVALMRRGRDSVQDAPTQPPMTDHGPSAAEQMTEKATHLATIEVANYGAITAELYGEAAPITVANFVKLANEGFYDGLTFHRIISGFMIQGGDPKGNGTGGSGQNIKGEFSQNGVVNNIPHLRGVLSMARSSMPDSASSQFFIMHEAAPHLDGGYAAFGCVLTGMDLVDAICQNTPVTDYNGTVNKANQPVITSIRVVEIAE